MGFSDFQVLLALASALVFILIDGIVLLVRRRQGKPVKLWREGLKAALAAYGMLALMLTVWPELWSGTSRQVYLSVNLTPFHTVGEYRQHLQNGSLNLNIIIENIFGNLMLLFPLGLLLPAIWPRLRRSWRTVLFCMACSVAIELLQLLITLIANNRTVDIDDVILNTAGAAVGYGVYWLVALVARKVSGKKTASA